MSLVKDDHSEQYSRDSVRALADFNRPCAAFHALSPSSSSAASSHYSHHHLHGALFPVPILYTTSGQDHLSHFGPLLETHLDPELRHLFLRCLVTVRASANSETRMSTNSVAKANVMVKRSYDSDNRIHEYAESSSMPCKS